MKKIVAFYDKYDEENRLTVRHKTEFFVTTYFLDSIIKGRNSILDMAAGAGIYSLYYAQRGCKVTALDIVPKHIELLTERISTDINIDASVGDARDLSNYTSASFDVVFNMGAIYHIEKEEIGNCLTESLRVLKTGGYLALAYINKFIDFEKDKFFNYFKFYSPSEIESFILPYNLEIISHNPTDGSLYEGFNEYLDNFYITYDNIPDGYVEFQESLSNIEDFHFWLDENYISKDIHSIDEKFIHALIILKKLA